MAKIANVKRGAAKRGQCRLIAGKWRGRIIKFDDAEGLRPTTDRIRETVFNWLQPYLAQSRCLDCFAGSGVLGFEALSRGARAVVFIEQNIKTFNKLKENARLLTLDAHVAVFEHDDALNWLQHPLLQKQSIESFDLVFLDPPFQADLLNRSCALLGNSGCLAEDAIIYVEHEIDNNLDVPENWTCLKHKNAGRVAYKLFIHKSINSRDNNVSNSRLSGNI